MGGGARRIDVCRLRHRRGGTYSSERGARVALLAMSRGPFGGCADTGQRSAGARVRLCACGIIRAPASIPFVRIARLHSSSPSGGVVAASPQSAVVYLNDLSKRFLGDDHVIPGRADIAYPQFYLLPYSGHSATIPEKIHAGFLQEVAACGFFSIALSDPRFDLR